MVSRAMLGIPLGIPFSQAAGSPNFVGYPFRHREGFTMSDARRRFASLRGVAVAALLAGTACGGGRGDNVVNDDPACSECSVQLQPLARLGKLEDPASHALFATVSRDSRGLYYVAPARGSGEILVYRPDGAFDRALGRTG